MSYYVDNGMFNSVDQFWQHCLGSFTKPPNLLDGKLLHVGIRMLDSRSQNMNKIVSVGFEVGNRNRCSKSYL